MLGGQRYAAARHEFTSWRPLSIHVLEANPQIVIPGNHCQSRRGPQADQPNLMNPIFLRERAAQDQRAKRHELEGRIPLG